MPRRVVKLTAQEILAAWRIHPLNLLDSYGSDPEIRARVIDAARERPRIEQTCQWLRDQWNELGIYIEAKHYDWMLAPESYELGTEAFWQVRTIQQLSSLDAMRAAGGMQPLNSCGVVIRQTFVTRYNSMSPRYRPWKGIHFIVFPQAFFDFAHMIWSSFATWCARDRPAAFSLWGATTTQVPEFSQSPVNAWLLEVIARQIATPARDLDVQAANAAGLIAAQVPFFERAARGTPLPTDDPFLGHVAYLLADFTVAHELGHRAASHGLGISEREKLAKELEADACGLDLFRASWGWRAEVVEGAPFDDALQPVVGHLVFFHTIRLRGLLAKAISVRAQQLGLTFRGIGWGDEEQQRAVEMSKLATAALQRTLSSGATVSADSLSRIGALASNLSLFGDHVVRSCLLIPEADLKAAIEIADDLGQAPF
jgi:hypothetical protein